jgi:hypothetical protein
MNAEEKKAHDEAVAKATKANTDRNNERLAKIEAIADSSEESRTEIEKLEIKDDSEEKEALAIAEDEKSAKALQEAGAIEEAKEPPVESDTKQVNGETYYRMMVNGQEKWQNLKEIRTAAQKVESADEYLRQASESVKNASRLALSPEKDEPSDLGEAEWADLLARNALGDVEATKLLASRLATRPSAVTPDVLRQIDQRLSFRTELATLEDKSKDLLDNQYTKRLFRDRLNELREENPNMGLTEAYSSIDKELRAAFPGVAKAKTQEKLERKRTLVNVPTAAGKQVAEEEPEGEEDVGSVIEKMAKARGAEPHVHSRR